MRSVHELSLHHLATLPSIFLSSKRNLQAASFSHGCSKNLAYRAASKEWGAAGERGAAEAADKAEAAEDAADTVEAAEDAGDTAEAAGDAGDTAEAAGDELLSLRQPFLPLPFSRRMPFLSASQKHALGKSTCSDFMTSPMESRLSSMQTKQRHRFFLVLNDRLA